MSKHSTTVDAIATRLLASNINAGQAHAIAKEIALHSDNTISREFIDIWLNNYTTKVEHQITQAKLEILKWVIGITLAETTGCIGTILAVAQHLW